MQARSPHSSIERVFVVRRVACVDLDGAVTHQHFKGLVDQRGVARASAVAQPGSAVEHLLIDRRYQSCTSHAVSVPLALRQYARVGIDPSPISRRWSRCPRPPISGVPRIRSSWIRVTSTAVQLRGRVALDNEPQDDALETFRPGRPNDRWWPRAVTYARFPSRAGHHSIPGCTLTRYGGIVRGQRRCRG